MLLPNPGSLIHSLHSSLKDDVLPTLEKGSAQRQLKATLHLLARLEKTWDLYGGHVVEDNKDIEKTLADMLDVLVEAGVGEQFKKLKSQLKKRHHVVEELSGLNDPSLIEASHRNLQLQECLQNFESVLVTAEIEETTREACADKLADLYRRMVARDAVYIGDSPPQVE
jgi:predicted nucleotidyltransferase component of viral defense system